MGRIMEQGQGQGFSARRIDMPAGVFESSGSDGHIASLHVGPPIRATCTRGGVTRRSLQAPGDIELIPAGEPGRWVDEAPAKIIAIKIAPTYYDAVAQSMGLKGKAAFPSSPCVRDVQLNSIGRAIEVALARQTNARSLVVDSLGLAFSARLLELAHARTIERPSAKLSRRQARLVDEFIEANISERLALKDLARVAGLKPSAFKALFKSTHGLPVHRYVVGRRVERAAALIRERTMPLSQIALDAGFAHQSHLARAMRRTLGLTPGALARVHR